MNASALPASVDALLELLTSRGYLAGAAARHVPNLSLRMGRPLFLEGEAASARPRSQRCCRGRWAEADPPACYEGLDRRITRS